MTIEITIATMGRLTKKLAMAYFASRARAAAGLGGGAGLAVTVIAVLHALQALDDDLLAGLEAVLDHPERVHARADLHVAELDLAAAVDDGDAVETLQLLHRALRHEQRVRLVLEQKPRAAVLAGRAAGRWDSETRSSMPRVPVVGIDRALDRVDLSRCAGTRVPSVSVSWMPSAPERRAGLRAVATRDPAGSRPR